MARVDTVAQGAEAVRKAIAAIEKAAPDHGILLVDVSRPLNNDEFARFTDLVARGIRRVAPD